jgi:drug/metabolite transporter (DMT)-like permease
MKNNKLGVNIVWILIPVIFWGISFISTKIVLHDIPPVSIAFFRQLIALVPLIAWLFYNKQAKLLPIKDIALLALSSFFGIVLYFVFENTGLVRTSASNASMIVASVPVFTLLAEALFFKQRISLKMVVFICLSICGVYFVISDNGKLDFSSATFIGNMLVMGAMVSWVVYTLLCRDLGKKYTSLIITTYQTGISSFLFIPFILNEIPLWKAPSTLSLLNLVFLGICCSALAYLSFLYAISKLGATTSSTFLNLVPVVSVITGYLVLGEKLTFLQFCGMSIILLSLYNLSRKKTTL